MSEQPANNYQDSAQREWQTPPLAASSVSVGITEIRSIRKSICSECGESVDSRAESCGACGATLTHSPKQISCMHCRTTASSELVVCPGCGRELREAPPKLMTVGAPAALALLLVIVIATQWDRVNPIAWLRNNVVRGVVLVEDISARIEPEVVIVMTPIVEGRSPIAAFVAPANVESDAMAVAMATDAEADETGQGEPTIVSMAAQDVPIGIGGPQGQRIGEETGASDEAVAGGEGNGNDGEAVALMSAPAEESAPTEPPLPTETPVPTDTPMPTATAEPPTSTVEPTATEQAPTPTSTWTATAFVVQSDVTSVSTAPSSATSPTTSPTVLATPTKSLAAGIAMAAASSAENDLPMPTPTVTPTLGPTPTATPVVYQVRSGDTLVTIASTYDVTVDELMAVNEMNEQDVYVIQPGQMLLIPGATPVPSRLEAPQLAIPPDGATLGCSTGGSLAWQRVQFVKDSDRYVLHLGFVSGQGDDGQESITWVVAQSNPVTQTEWQLDTALCDLASAEYGKQWRWWVEVVESTDAGALPISPPSEIRRFIWQ